MIGVIILFWGLDYFVNYSEWTSIGEIRRMCNITREDSLASWVQVTQTLLAGLTALTIWLGVRAASAPAWRRRGWLVVALFFLYMAMDDGAQIHERVGTALDVLRERGVGPGVMFPSYAGQILFVPILGGVGLWVAIFLWGTFSSRAARAALVLAVVLQAAAVGLDFQEGLAPEHPWNLYAWTVQRWDIKDFAEAHFGETPFDTVTHFSESIEEGIEMVSISIFWALFISRLSREPGEILFRFRRG